MAKVMVTGSAGFIGGYVVEELLARGHEVIGVDNYSKYGPVTKSYDGHPRYTFVHGDVRDAELMTTLVSDCKHLIAGAALIGGISYFHTYPYDLLATNERIIAAACDAAIAAHRSGALQKVTYLSSSMVFESTTTWPSVEGDERRVSRTSLDITRSGITESGPGGIIYRRNAKGRWEEAGGFGIGALQAMAAVLAGWLMWRWSRASGPARRAVAPVWIYCWPPLTSAQLAARSASI